MNSIGSVTPVRNEVSAIESSRPPTAARLSGSAVRYMARQAAGRPNIITGKKPDMNAPARGIAGEEALQVAGDAVEVAEQEPRDVVEDVVQAGDDQHAVQHAVDEQPDVSGAEHRLAHGVHAAARASGQPKPKTSASTRPAKPLTMGTKRRPPKNAR